MKIYDLKKFIKDIDDDFDVILTLLVHVSDNELELRTYKHPYDFYNLQLEQGDIGYSNKKISLIAYHKDI